MSKYWCWCDMEMTGLDDNDLILEVAIIITSADKNLDIIDVSDNYIIHREQKILDQMNSWCQKHHEQSGLKQKVLESNSTIEQVQSDILKWIGPYVDMTDKMPLCGNSINTDRNFMKREMPQLHDCFHYRSIDVTSIKLILDKVSDIKPFVKKQTHRALDDINESILELKYYLDNQYILTNK